MGLHRDGARLGVSPFQAEIRRRLWWHLITRDMRAGEDYGLDIGNSVMLTTDVGLPLSVEDTDICPEMKELPAVKNGWTAMSFSLIHIKISQTMQRLGQILASRSLSSQMDDERAKIIADLREWVEERLAQCNPVIPRNRMAVSCSRWLIQKLDFITRTQWLMLKNAGGREFLATDDHLLEALEILEPRVSNTDGLLDQFAWVRKVFPQYYVTMYILWHLCVKPEGPHVSRAWRTVDTVLSGELWSDYTSGSGAKSAVLPALRARASALRDGLQRRGSGSGVKASDCDLSRETERLSPRDEIPTSSHLGDAYSGDINFGVESDMWPDWTMLAQEFQADGQAFMGTVWEHENLE